MKKGFVLGFVSVLCLLFLPAGCGKSEDPELESYKKTMTRFYDKLTDYDIAINAIDAESEGAAKELLGYLDEMNEEYAIMAKEPVPDEFGGISDITLEAAEYMQKADEFYHLAYDDSFDADSELLASQYYQRANSRVKVMLEVLHGKVPEGEGISVETKSTYEFSVIEDEDNADSDEN